MALSREQTAERYAEHRRLHEAGDWVGLGELFADDCEYFDAFYGWNRGLDHVRTFLHDSMQGLDDWEFPIAWVVIDEGRVVTHWQNRLPGQRADGTHFEFPGMSAITFGDDGRITQQMDLYDTGAATRVMAEWQEATGRTVGDLASS